MSKTTLLLSALLLFTGCAERGYILTTNTRIHTITAESVSSLTKESKEDDAVIFKKMTTAVKKAQKEEGVNPPALPKKRPLQTKKTKRIPKEIKKIVIPQEKRQNNVVPKFIPKKVEIKENIELPNPVKVSQTATYPDDENNFREQARKSQERREARLREIAKLRKNPLRKNPLRKEIKNSNIELAKKQNVNTAKKAELERKIALEKEKTLLEQKIEQQKIEQQKAAALLSKKTMEQEVSQKQQHIKEKPQEKINNIKKLSKKDPNAFTKPLVFKQIDKIYHKFGTSEVHGHVIYLAENGQETRLGHTTIYLLPVSKKLNLWFNNYYLKNKHDGKRSIVRYLNKTSLNLERNFEFFGVPKGSYYIIIESNNPKSNNKVYIAKKIQVGKYKKVMGVFSKKL